MASPGRANPTRRLVLAVVLLNLGAAAWVGVDLRHGYFDRLRRAEIDSRNLADVLARTIDSTIERIDTALTAAETELERQVATGAIDGPAVDAYLTRLSGAVSQLVGMRATDAQGVVRYGVDVPRTAPPSMADRPYFQVHRDDPARGLFFGAPVMSRINKVWVLNFARRLDDREGRFSGVVFANLPLANVARVFGELDVGPQGVVALRGADLGVVVRHPAPGGLGAWLGRQDEVPELGALALTAQQAAGTFSTRGDLGQPARTVSFRRVGTYPLFVCVALGRDDTLGPWMAEAWFRLGWLLLFAVLSGGGALLLGRSWRRRLEDERRLELENEKFHTVTDFTHDWEYWEGPEGELHYMSPSCERVTGYPAASFLAEPALLWRLVHPDDRDAVAQHQCRGAVGLAEIDFRIVRREGDVRWINHRCQPVTSADGRPLGRRVSNRDITDRRLFEQEINRLAQAVEQSPVGLFITDLQGELVFSNQASQRITGLSFAEAHARAPARRLASALTDEAFGDIVRGLTAGRPWSGTLSHRSPKGEPRWLRVSAAPLYDPSGQLANFMYVLQDLTDQVQAQEALQAKSDELDRYFTMTLDLLCIADTSGRFLRLNPSWEATLGYPMAELVGRNFLDLVHPEDLESTRQALSVLAGQREVINFVNRYRHRDGSYRWLEWCSHPQGQAVYAVARDVTERRQAEAALREHKQQLEAQVQVRTAELREARDAAETSNRAKSVFLANMSHELRTPLNAILGFSSLMQRDEAVPDRQKQNLAIINRSGAHLLDLINDVLEMAKIEAGRVQLEEAPFDLGAMVRDVSDMMNLRAQEKGLRLLIDQSSKFPRFIVGDEARLRQILINLVGNAVKFTVQGGVTVRLGRQAEPRPRLIIEVEDSGPGIAPKDQQRLFEPFVQLGTDSVNKGTGLGLAITRQFVELMHGALSVESTVGKGSVFRVELPLKLPAEGALTVAREVAVGEVVGLAPGQPDVRVLIAEDQLENQVLLCKLMQDIGVPFQVASNGEDAVKLFAQWHPHLIWMDRRMPGLDGLEAARRIRALPGGRDVKIVAVTASAFKEQREEMLAAGMDDFLRKPYRLSEIYECMTRHLGLRYVYQGQAAAEAPSAVVLPPERVQALPAALRAELKAALETLDSECVGRVIALIAPLDEELGRALSRLAENYQYPAILAALEPAHA